MTSFIRGGKVALCSTPNFFLIMIICHHIYILAVAVRYKPAYIAKAQLALVLSFLKRIVDCFIQRKLR